MPSIRVRNSARTSVRDIFNQQQQSPVIPTGNTLQVPTTQNENEYNARPLSLSQTRHSDTGPTSPVSIDLSQDLGTRRIPRARSSRILSHVLSTKRSSQWLHSMQSHRRMSSESTTALNPDGTAPAQDRHGRLRVHGSQADIVLDNAGEDEGVIETTFSFPEPGPSTIHDGNHHDDIVEHLDVIDQQVATVSNLTNAANSIVIPPLGFNSRKPVIVLSSPTRQNRDQEKGGFEDPLDAHVDDVLNSPSKIRRTLLGIWSFLKTPMGILTGIYGFLVVFWGAAIVFFLAKFINLHNANTQGFWVEVSSQIVCGLFTVTSVGFIPSRILSTYRIYKIWRYKRMTIKRRRAAGLPQLFDRDDLPDPVYDPNFARVLTDEEHKDLHRQQIKFAYHQTWYRAHGTETHRAFPISMALWICLLNDWNSIFQVMLCGTMWGMNRFERPAWTTGILIPAGFLCGIGAGVLIWRGGERTKRVEEVRQRLRAALTAEQAQTQQISHPRRLTPLKRQTTADGPRRPTLKVTRRPSVPHQMTDATENKEGPEEIEYMTVPETNAAEEIEYMTVPKTTSTKLNPT